MTTLSIHEEASQAYREALADGCACWRCQDAGLRAVLKAVAKRLRDIDDGAHGAESFAGYMAPRLRALSDEMLASPPPRDSDK